MSVVAPPEPERAGRSRAVAVIAGLNALAALFGAVGLATGWLPLGDDVVDRLPGDSVELAGIALALAVAVPNAALAVLAARRHRRWGAAAVLVGTALALWILVEVAIVRDLSPLQPVYGAIGLVMCWLGATSRRVR